MRWVLGDEAEEGTVAIKAPGPSSSLGITELNLFLSPAPVTLRGAIRAAMGPDVAERDGARMSRVCKRTCDHLELRSAALSFEVCVLNRKLTH
jgi:hypothetical protein